LDEVKLFFLGGGGKLNPWPTDLTGFSFRDLSHGEPARKVQDGCHEDTIEKVCSTQLCVTLEAKNRRCGRAHTHTQIVGNDGNVFLSCDPSTFNWFPDSISTFPWILAQKLLPGLLPMTWKMSLPIGMAAGRGPFGSL